MAYNSTLGTNLADGAVAGKDQYKTVLPERSVMVIDLAAQSMIA
jgi:hypothetical protein